MEILEKCLEAYQQLVSRYVEVRWGQKKTDTKLQSSSQTGVESRLNWTWFSSTQSEYSSHICMSI